LGFLEFLTAVLLIADDSLYPPFWQIKGVVQDGLVVPDLLEGEGILIGVYS